MKKIKQYYRIKFKLTSPLSVGSGENDITDHDILFDNRGIPYIPGTALAGVYRRLFMQETADTYFGKLLTNELIESDSGKGVNFLTESEVIVYDAVLNGADEWTVAVRDMVALDAYKVSIPGEKFDFQVLEPGCQFVTYIEQNKAERKCGNILAEIASAWQQGEIRLGAKSTRGYGKTEVVEIMQCCFDLQNQKEVERWLGFDMYEDDLWEKPNENLISDESIKRKQSKKVNILLELKQAGGISVRQYSTDIDAADYMQMARRSGSENKEDIPFIPGTSWAGAFRAQFEELDSAFSRDTELAELFFGKKTGSEDEERWKSRVCFSESELAGGRWEIYSRNAISRFSGGTIDGALYTEKSYFDGEADLQISCDMTEIMEKDVRRFYSVLSAAILDLDRGFMSIGGLTSVGHGLFRVKRIKISNKLSWDETVIDLENIDEEKQYIMLKEALGGGQK